MSLRDQLQAVYDQHGHLTPKLVVDLARDPAHPLHRHVFDRDAAEAAEAYYLNRAHRLIVSVKVVYREHEDGRQEKIRRYHAVRTEQGYVYEPAEKIAQDPLKAKLLLQDMEREWRALKRRYGHMAEFLDLVRSDVGDAA